MLKALVKKQFKELTSFYLMSRKTKKRKVGTAAKSTLIILSICYLVLMAFFGFTAYEICPALTVLNQDWLYFVLLGIGASVLGLIGSVFSTYSSVYKAKDNELLLSFPFSPSQILFSRILGVYIFTLIYESVVYIPTMVVYWMNRQQTVWMIISQIIIMFVIGLLVLLLSCILGWVVAKVSAHINNKTVGTVVIAIVLIGLYYFFYFRLNVIIRSIIANIDTIGESIKGSFYPAYAMGMGAAGDALSLLIFVAIVGAAFAIVYFILAKTFISMVTKKTGVKKVAFKSEAIKAGSIKSALLSRELRHLSQSAAWILNCGITLLILLALAVFAMIKSELIGELLKQFIDQIGFFNRSAVPVFLIAVICLIAGMCTFSSASVSLEGKSIWIVQSLPVDASLVLQAKVKMHYFVTIIPVLVSVILVGISFQFNAQGMIAALVFAIVFVKFQAVVGVNLNVKRANLDWVNETIPIKQSLCVFFSMLIAMGVAIVTAGVYFLLRNIIDGAVWIFIMTVILAAATYLIERWNNTKGAELFSKLA